jgi:hypothetical protein
MAQVDNRGLVMTHDETLERYRRMTNAERAAVTCRMIRENWPALFHGPADVVARRFERINAENDARNRNMLRAMAVRVYGIPRATYDLDFTIGLDRTRLPGLYARFEALGYTVPEAYQRGWVDEVAGLPLVKCQFSSGGRGIDLDFFLAESRYQEEVLRRRRREQVNGVTAWLVSPEDLILLKLIAHRPRDLADVGDVLFTQGDLDQAYLRHWATELHVRERLDDVLRTASE